MARRATGMRTGEAAGLVLAALALSSAAGCDPGPTARAYQATDRSQLVGGPSAIGEIGDFVLENDRIRAVILQGGNSVGPGMFGGTLVDADLRRPELSHTAGRGNDQFAELFPMVNLVVPGYQDDRGPGIGDLAVSIVSDGESGQCPLDAERAPDGCAAIRVAGNGDRIIEALGTIELLDVQMNLSFVTYYILMPGERYVLVRTFFWDHNVWWPGDYAGTDEEASELERLAADAPISMLDDSVPIFEALVGDALDEDFAGCPAGEACYRHPGFLAGDFLMFGKNLSPFGTSVLGAPDGSDRSGFDLSYLFQRRYDRGEIVLATPLADSVLVGVGDRVSYGYMSEGGMVVLPILTGSFSGAFTHGYQCVTETDDDTATQACRDALRRPLMYDRYLVIGDGDAASVLETYYELTGTPSGRVSGHVLDELSGGPLTEARVFALLDPRVDADGNVDESLSVSDYEAARRAIEGRFSGDSAVASFAAVDSGIDRVADASFELRLEPGRYLLVPVVSGRAPGRPVPVEVEAGSHQDLSLAVPAAGLLSYEIVDDRGLVVPAKLTIIGPLEEDAECPSDLPIPELSSIRHLELGSSERPNGIAKIHFSEHGRGQVELAPGIYDVIASRGFEYSIDRQCIEVRHDSAPIRHFSVLREVETTGWVAGDFHVHGVNSYDGSMTHEQRIVSAVAEGIEVFSTTDHDYITNLEPVVFDMDMRDQVHTMVGIEVTPIETGHLLGYPLRFDETQVDNGAIDWSRRDRCLESTEAFGCPDGATGYIALTPQETFDELRALGEFGPEHTVVTVPHPRDGFFGYFDQFNVSHFDLRLDPPSMVQGANPLLGDFVAPGNARVRLYSENFDAIELFNGRRYEFIRTPTVGEVNDFVDELARIGTEAADEDEFARLLVAAHERSMRRVLVRTPEEQGAMRMGVSRPDDGGPWIECIDHEDCDEGLICDPHRYACVDELPSCDEDEDCVESCIDRLRCSGSGDVCSSADDCGGAETCDPSSECITTTAACAEDTDCFTSCVDGRCVPAPFSCAGDDDCPRSYSCDEETSTCQPPFAACSTSLPCPRGYVCQSGTVPGADGGRCLEACESDDDCRLDEYCFGEEGQASSCRLASCNIGADAWVVAEERRREDRNRPCVRNEASHAEGVVDDWFRLLNYGAAYTAMANSDTHTTSSEIGLPRNFVMSSADAPPLVSRQEIADNIRAYRVVASYGPFIELSAAGGTIGDTVSSTGTVELRLRVQSASWFDVDRIELYANGDLLCDIGEGSTESSRCRTDADIAVDSAGHNTDIVNFEGTIEHEPEIDTWYVAVAMGVGEGARGLAPVYLPSIHPQLGFTEVIGQAFASFEVDLLSAVVPPAVQRAEVNAMIPYAITNPIWVESEGDDDELWTPPSGVPSYRRSIPCQFARGQEGCQEVDVMPLSTESLGRSPLLVEAEDDPTGMRVRRMLMIQRALMRLAGGGC